MGLLRDLNFKLSDRPPPDKIALAEGGTVLFETRSIDTVGGIVSSAAVFWDVTQCSPQRNGCSQPNHIPLPILANQSFGFIFKNQFAPNSPFETCRAQSENVFYLCIPSSETSQINMRISGLCLGTPKNTGDAV